MGGAFEYGIIKPLMLTFFMDEEIKILILLELF